VRGAATGAGVAGDEWVRTLDPVYGAETLMANSRKIRADLVMPVTQESKQMVEMGTRIGPATYPLNGASAGQPLTPTARTIVNRNSEFFDLHVGHVG
jgi:hypothetical protein